MTRYDFWWFLLSTLLGDMPNHIWLVILYISTFAALECAIVQFPIPRSVSRWWEFTLWFVTMQLHGPPKSFSASNIVARVHQRRFSFHFVLLFYTSLSPPISCTSLTVRDMFINNCQEGGCTNSLIEKWYHFQSAHSKAQSPP